MKEGDDLGVKGREQSNFYGNSEDNQLFGMEPSGDGSLHNVG